MRKKRQWLDEYQWHEWFAWYPIWVNTGDCKDTRIWLERVQRKYAMSYSGTYTQIRNLDGSDIE